MLRYKLRYLQFRKEMPPRLIGDTHFGANDDISAKKEALRLAADNPLPQADGFQLIYGMNVLIQCNLAGEDRAHRT